ncbi:MAG TPA: biotin--[acetyl-CoA-carboxylase] ligase [Gemmataceae bacterium]|jgi:BirA family biotin operon repressor/biotin-[acetyl-CoA-carboxylase] ligase|nr:biotin--[acetyl-CoA-carboxylase] ligase [Gemmataceae bacterium]
MNSHRHIGRRHIHLDATDSTNSRAAELAHDPANAGTVITADIQTRGRGQHGRIWESPTGVNVLLSTLLFPPPVLRRPVVLTAFAATVVADTIFQVTGRQSRIKWPNDVLIDGKKVCGILIEGGVAAPNAEPYFVVGIGLNINQSPDDFAKLGLTQATSLSMAAGRRFDLKEIASILIDNLDTEYERLSSGETSSLEARWLDRLGLTGRDVTIELMDATEVRGQLTSLSFAGLSVASAAGTVRKFAPEMVRHVR